MNIKENLLQLCDIRKEIKELEIKISKLESKSHDIVCDVVDGTTINKPIIQTHKKIFGLDIKTNKQLEKYNTILNERYEKILEIQTQTEKFINSIDNSRLRRIFEYRYIEQFSWPKIAILIGNCTEESIRKEHDRFLRKK